VDNATQLIKEVPDQVNSLVSKHAPVTMEADMKHCNLANKIASENSGFEILRNIYCRPSDPRYWSHPLKDTTQGVFPQHIKGLTDQVGSSVGKFASENPFRNPFHPSLRRRCWLYRLKGTALDVVIEFIKQLLDQVRSLVSKILSES